MSKRQRKPLTFGSLFAGIGGLDLGLERAGLRCLWQVENNPYACSILGKHWSQIHRHGDVKTFARQDASLIPLVDLICGGFPCQDVSHAGKRAGIDGTRSGLWSEFHRIIRVLRPRFVVVENAPGLLDSGLGRVLGDLASLGFDAEWESLPASIFGAPHERERVFIVAYPRGFFGESGGVFHGKHAIPRDPQWVSTQNIKSGSEWKRWLGEASSSLDRDGSHKWFRPMDDGFPTKLDREELQGIGNAVVPQAGEFIGRLLIDSIKRGCPK